MAPTTGQPKRNEVWRVASRQHDRITYVQLLKLGLTPDAVRHRVRTGRLIRVARDLYAISRPRGTDEERWMEAVLRCVPGTLVGDRDASALWGFDHKLGDGVHVCVPASCRSRPRGLVVHRRSMDLAKESWVRNFIPVTSPALTLIDNADRWGDEQLEAMINKAHGMRIATPDGVRRVAALHSRVRGAARVARVLDRLTFALTDSELERIFRRLLRTAGLPQPLTQRRPETHRVDFLWPDLGLIVEADSLRHHGTAMAQRTDVRRDRAHKVAGLETLRFTHYEICFEPEVVLRDLTVVIERQQQLKASADHLSAP